jgi:hypothetical protein
MQSRALVDGRTWRVPPRSDHVVQEKDLGNTGAVKHLELDSSESLEIRVEGHGLELAVLQGRAGGNAKVLPNYDVAKTRPVKVTLEPRHSQSARRRTWRVATHICGGHIEPERVIKVVGTANQAWVGRVLGFGHEHGNMRGRFRYKRYWRKRDICIVGIEYQIMIRTEDWWECGIVFGDVFRQIVKLAPISSGSQAVVTRPLQLTSKTKSADEAHDDWVGTAVDEVVLRECEGWTVGTVTVTVVEALDVLNPLDNPDVSDSKIVVVDREWASESGVQARVVKPPQVSLVDVGYVRRDVWVGLTG